MKNERREVEDEDKDYTLHVSLCPSMYLCIYVPIYLPIDLLIHRSIYLARLLIYDIYIYKYMIYIDAL